VENFGFIMRGDFFWRHWFSVFGLWSLVYRISNPVKKKSKTKNQRPKTSSLIFRHHVFTAAKKITHFTFLRHGQNFEAVRASLFQLLLLHVREFRQMFFGPAILDKFERIIFPQRMALPIGRQKNASQ